MGLGSLFKPIENLFHHDSPAPAHAATPAPAAAPAVHATPEPATTAGAAQIGAAALGGASDNGPRLNSTWNHLMGGPGQQAGDGRPLSVNHIGNKYGGGPFAENGPVSNAMRDTPYLGDYWEALAVTHDSEHIHPPILNGLTAVTNVGLTGPLMALADAPFRLFGHSLFLDENHK